MFITAVDHSLCHFWQNNFWHKYAKICTFYTDQPYYCLICIVLLKGRMVEHVLFFGYLGYSGRRLLQPRKAMQCKFDPQTILINFLHCAFPSWISVRKTILPNVFNVLRSHNFRQSRAISSDWRNLIESDLERGKNIHCSILHFNTQTYECTMQM